VNEHQEVTDLIALEAGEPNAELDARLASVNESGRELSGAGSRAEKKRYMTVPDSDSGKLAEILLSLREIKDMLGEMGARAGFGGEVGTPVWLFIFPMAERALTVISRLWSPPNI